MSRRNVKPYTKRKSITILSISIIGFILSIGSLLIGVALLENNYDDNIYLPFCFAFFPLMILDLIFLIYHFPGLMLHDIKKQMDKTKSIGYECFEDINEDVIGFLNTNHFTLLEEGYYHKRKFSFFKDYVNFYIKKVYSQNAKATINTQYSKFDSYQFKRNHKCFILFIEMENVSEEDLETLVENASIFISMEIVPNIMDDASVIVILDNTKKCAYCVPPGKNKFSFYNLGYKQMKKILNVQKHK